jgi:hypothetical protein
MLEFFSPDLYLSWDLVWQPCLFLAVGIGATLVLGRRPARAHRVLVLALLASLHTIVLPVDSPRGSGNS